MKTIFKLFLILIIFSSCTKEEIEIYEEPKTFNEIILDYVNEIRVNGLEFEDVYYTGRDSLYPADNLMKASQIHCDYMFKNGLTHTWENDREMRDILYGYTYFSQAVEKKYIETPEEFIKVFLSKQCNCDFIMNANAKFIGIANKGEYWCLMLAK